MQKERRPESNSEPSANNQYYLLWIAFDIIDYFEKKKKNEKNGN